MEASTSDLTPWSADARVAEAVFVGAPCGILVIDVLGTCVAANDAMVRMKLVSPEAVGKPLDRVALAGVVACVTDAIEECGISREPHSAEHIFDVGGKETWWLVASSPVHAPTGGLTHVICTFFYVDFLKRTEEALRRSEKTFRTLIEHVPDAVIVADRSAVRYANPAAASLLGTAPDSQVVGTNPFSLLDPADREAVRDSLRSVVRGQGTRLVEARVVRPDGRRLAIDFVPIPTLYEGRACVLVVARDVTERNELHARLAQADRSIALGSLAAGIAHEINTPLAYVQTNISYVIERLEDGAASPEELRQALGEALQGVKQVAATVRELRALATTDATAMVNFDVRELLQHVMQLVRPDVERKARLVLGEWGPVSHVHASSLLPHVFLNLLQNAAQAVPGGAPERNEVRIDVTARDEGVVVEVSDTGSGIAPHHLPRIFDPFFTTKPAGEGSGLGLALAQRIVHASGGRIAARSAGRGATFEVWLPRAVVSEAP